MSICWLIYILKYFTNLKDVLSKVLVRKQCEWQPEVDLSQIFTSAEIFLDHGMFSSLWAVECDIKGEFNQKYYKVQTPSSWCKISLLGNFFFRIHGSVYWVLLTIKHADFVLIPYPIALVFILTIFMVEGILFCVTPLFSSLNKKLFKSVTPYKG